jgi:hypothetical protein
MAVAGSVTSLRGLPYSVYSLKVVYLELWQVRNKDPARSSRLARASEHMHFQWQEIQSPLKSAHISSTVLSDFVFS